MKNATKQARPLRECRFIDGGDGFRVLPAG